MYGSKLAAKKNKKRKGSDDISSDEYQERRLTKLRKASKVSKREVETKKKKQSALNKYGLESSSESDSINDEADRNRANFIPLDIFNPDRIFTQILNKASKEPDFLIMLKNLLSGCSRTMIDKQNIYKKKWKQLRNSNCSQQEYLSREAELKRTQCEDLQQMEKDIMTKLSYANVKGFETRNSLIQSYKRQVGHNQHTSFQPNLQYEIEDQTWEKYYQAQKKLLQMLMKENDFVSQDYTPSNLIKTYSQNIKQKEHVIKQQVFEDNQLGMKMNTLDTEENPQATQFLFCKHYKDIDYDKVFSNGMNSFKPYENEKFFVEPKAMSWLLQLKSDEIYQNDTFQKQTYKKYNEILKSIYQAPQRYSDAEIISNLLEVGAYILNAVHYYQKFKLKCDLLHPLDLLLVIQKVKKQRRKSNSPNDNVEMIDEKYEKIEHEAISINKMYEEIAQHY